ncbi:MAG: hypothetical protein M1617_07295 [Actinobacteria bacterium]|nr:hypothetical protein [Actinomycetota bacterium]
MRPSIVCYADILGYDALSREAVEDDRGDEFLLRIYRAMTRVHGAMHSHNSVHGRHLYELKAFTDNVVVGYPILDTGLGEIELLDILELFAQFQANLAAAGFLARGGIAFGDHYMGDDVVFGPALLDAVAAEKRGGAPRLALTDSAVELLQLHGEFYGLPRYAPSSDYVLRDADGVFFLNYLAIAFMLFPESGVSIEHIEGHASTVSHGLVTYVANPGVRGKYEWAARYHNYVCRDFVRRHPVPVGSAGDPEYVAACEDAQRLLEYLIDIEALAAHPESPW